MHKCKWWVPSYREKESKTNKRERIIAPIAWGHGSSHLSNRGCTKYSAVGHATVGPLHGCQIMILVRTAISIISYTCVYRTRWGRELEVKAHKPGEITLMRSSNSLVPRPYFPSAESALENNHGERGVVELLGFGCSVVPWPLYWRWKGVQAERRDSVCRRCT